MDYGPEAGEDSYDLWPLLNGECREPVREATLHHSIDGSFAIRQGHWKLVCCPGSGGWTAPTAKQPAGTPSVQLYHLGQDLGETNNLYQQHPEVVTGLQTLVERYLLVGRSVPPRGSGVRSRRAAGS